MGLGICIKKCCNPCNICPDNKVPSYLTLEMSGWADAYINNSDLCPTDTGTTMVSPLSELNGAFQLDLVREWSGPSADFCCATYYVEVPYSDYIARSGNASPDPYNFCSAGNLHFDTTAYVRNNTVGIVATVYYNGGTTLYVVITCSLLPADSQVVTLCLPVSAGGGAWETDPDWFCEGSSSGDLLAIDPSFVYDTWGTLDNSLTLLSIGSYNSAPGDPDPDPTIIGDSGPTLVTLTASSTRVRL